jgi:hypothetical protein
LAVPGREQNRPSRGEFTDIMGTLYNAKSFEDQWNNNGKIKEYQWKSNGR